jgi:regulator of RNase E activity RraA
MGTPRLDHSLLLTLKRFDTPTVSNAIETFDVRPRNQGYLRPEIRCVFPELGSMIGYAVTGRIRASQPAPDGVYLRRRDWWDYILTIPEPRVIVLEDLDDPPGAGSFWGEVNANIHRALGCVGAVTNGCVRDLKEVRELGFQFYAQHVGVSHAYVHMIDFGTPVTVGGATIQPGDLIHADLHGVHTIPHQIAPDIPAAIATLVAAERRIIDYCQLSEFSIEGLKRLTRG